MSVEEMIEQLSIDVENKFTFPVRVILPEDAEQIIAALRAGEEMRLMLNEIADSESLVCCQDWDVATQVDV